MAPVKVMEKVVYEQREDLKASYEVDYREIPKNLVLENECLGNLYIEKRELYDDVHTLLSSTFPAMDVYDVGNVCLLKRGYQLISLSHFNNQESGQTIVLFDADYNLIACTEGLSVKTAGDLSAPLIKEIKDGIVLFSLGGGDAGLKHQSFLLCF